MSQKKSIRIKYTVLSSAWLVVMTALWLFVGDHLFRSSGYQDNVHSKSTNASPSVGTGTSHNQSSSKSSQEWYVTADKRSDGKPSDEEKWEPADQLGLTERLLQIEELENQISSENAIIRLNSGDVTQGERNHYGRIFQRIVALKERNIAEKLQAIQREFESLKIENKNNKRESM
jgi:hypothetical protein